MMTHQQCHCGVNNMLAAVVDKAGTQPSLALVAVLAMMEYSNIEPVQVAEI